jgi:hypothetical protein
MGMDIKNVGAYEMQPMVNLFIIGSQKSGTSSLHNYINCHHNIYAPVFKEPALFRDFNYVKNYYKRRFNLDFESKIDYQNHMLKGYNSEQYICDSSTFYTIGNISKREETPKSINSLSPNAKFIYIMRNPFERLYSNYAHSIKMGDTKVNIEQYFDHYVDYIETSKYYTQISRYLKYFSKESFVFLSFESLKNKPKETITKIYRHLNLAYDDSDFPKEYIVFNKTASLQGDVKVENIFSYGFYTKLMLSFKQEINDLKKIGFNPNWDISPERWVNNSKKPFSLYPSLGYLGLLRKNDIPSLKSFINECKNEIIKQKAILALNRINSV